MSKDFYKSRFLGILIALAVIAGLSVAAMMLWNALMPDIFGLPPLSYWQAAGILVLARILFGGLGMGRFTPRRGFEFLQGNKLREKWMNMSAEEQKAFAEKEKDFRNLFNDRFSRFRQFYEETEKNNKEGDGNE
jgi:ABC-type multidrug transport system fused ATPase/permease subunit